MVLKEKVYQAIKERIINGEYKPGEPLNEKEITEELNVSRTPFREAINALDKENLVQIYANRGIFVREFTARDLADNFEIRFLLEPYVSRLVCRCIPKAVVQDLIDRGQAALNGSFQDMLSEDLGYHQTTLRYVDNRQLVDMMVSLYEQNKIQVAMYDHAESGRVSEARKHGAEESIREHLNILEHMLNGDEEGAYQSTQQHLLEAQRRAMTLPVRI